MKLRDFSSKEVSAEILEAAKSDCVMRYRLSGYIDLIAANAKYHSPYKKKKKKKKFKKNPQRKLSKNSGVFRMVPYCEWLL